MPGTELHGFGPPVMQAPLPCAGDAEVLLQPPCSIGAHGGAWHGGKYAMSELLSVQAFESDSDDCSSHGTSASSSCSSSCDGPGTAIEAAAQPCDGPYDDTDALSDQLSSFAWSSSSSTFSAAAAAHGFDDGDDPSVIELNMFDEATDDEAYLKGDDRRAARFLQDLKDFPGDVAASPNVGRSMDACLWASKDFWRRTDEQEVVRCCMALCTDPNLQHLATVERVVASVDIFAWWRDEHSQGSASTSFLPDELRAAFCQADKWLQRHMRSFTPTTLLAWLEACKRLRAASDALLTDGTTWAKGAVDNMAPRDLVKALAACASLNMRGCWLTGAILQRLDQSVANCRQGHPRVKLSRCMWAQLAHAIALLRATDHLQLCLAAVRACADAWSSHGGVSKGTLSMLGRVVRFFEHCGSAAYAEVLHEGQLWEIQDQLKAQGEAVRPSRQQRHIHQLLRDGLPGCSMCGFWRTPPVLEQMTASAASTMDIHCVTQSGLMVAWQFDGPQHYVQWFNNGWPPDVEDATAVVVLPTLRLNGGTCFRNEDQCFEGYEVICICCTDFQALGPDKHAQLQYLLQQLAAVDAASADKYILAGRACCRGAFAAACTDNDVLPQGQAGGLAVRPLDCRGAVAGATTVLGTKW